MRKLKDIRLILSYLSQPNTLLEFDGLHYTILPIHEEITKQKFDFLLRNSCLELAKESKWSCIKYYRLNKDKYKSIL